MFVPLVFFAPTLLTLCCFQLHLRWISSLYSRRRPGRFWSTSAAVFGFVWHGFFLFAWPIFVVALLCRCVCLLCETRAALRQARATLAARETPL